MAVVTKMPRQPVPAIRGVDVFSSRGDDDDWAEPVRPRSVTMLTVPWQIRKLRLPSVQVVLASSSVFSPGTRCAPTFHTCAAGREADLIAVRGRVVDRHEVADVQVDLPEVGAELRAELPHGRRQLRRHGQVVASVAQRGHRQGQGGDCQAHKRRSGRWLMAPEPARVTRPPSSRPTVAVRRQGYLSGGRLRDRSLASNEATRPPVALPKVVRHSRGSPAHPRASRAGATRARTARRLKAPPFSSEFVDGSR